MYESPIERYVEDITKKEEDYLIEMVRKVGFNIDKDELAKALKYDRDQYIKGFNDGIAHAERKKMSNKDWVDFLSKQFNVSRTSAHEMLHGLMRWKAEDNFKKQFSGRREIVNNG